MPDEKQFPMNATSTDYVIVGAGSAGAVVANRLSEDARVTLLEAGSTDHGWDYRLHMPAALSHVLASDTYNWSYFSQPEPGLANRRIYCPRGRVLGGSSSINGMVFVRGNPHDFDLWAEDPALSMWRYEHCLPYFRKSERRPHGDEGYRGETGPMQVARARGAGVLNEAWIHGAMQAGYRQSSDFNGEAQEGVGRFDCTIRKGRRFSTARAYLHPIISRSNLDIVKRAATTRILFEGDRAVGVEYLKAGRLHRIHADAEVILCAGAINSPQLLMLSGVGNADQLRELDIPVHLDLKGVGQNLQDHLELYVQYSCRKPVSVYPSARWYRKPFVGLQWYLSNTGAGATNHFETGGFLRSSDTLTYPDLQFHFLPIAMNYDGRDRYSGHGFQVHVGPMKPTSRGEVKLRTADPRDAPLIQFNYNSTAADRQVMRRGILTVQEIVGQAAFDGLRGDELKPGNTDISTFIEQHAESAYHPCCTCKMGSDEMAVVDGAGQVHGLSNLRVVDASIMPDITNGNLNAPVIMMAEKLSDVIRGKITV